MSCAAGSESAPSAPQVWLHAPYELHLSLFEHFIELLTESRQVSEGSFPEQETDHMKKKMTFIFFVTADWHNYFHFNVKASHCVFC